MFPSQEQVNEKKHKTSRCAAVITLSLQHHCRKCGRVVCGDCSPHTFLLPAISSNPSRVCTPCFNTLKDRGDSPLATPQPTLPQGSSGLTRPATELQSGNIKVLPSNHFKLVYFTLHIFQKTWVTANKMVHKKSYSGPVFFKPFKWHDPLLLVALALACKTICRS